MALHPDFPTSPHTILDPRIRWIPADETLREKSMANLLPPLVTLLRKEVKQWRDSGYEDAADTSRSLLNWWFKIPHMIPTSDGLLQEFKYYFAQREALETIIYLYDVVGVKDKYDLMRFDGSERVSASMFAEDWRRFVVKMATGSGKTKVLSLVLAWSYFHKLYEPNSTLARNFLVITPNIIVLDRVYRDFKGLDIFFHDPVLPDNGYEGHDWRNDFQLTLHLQDNVNITRKTGNIFLTNIHRVYADNDSLPSAGDQDARDYFLGPRPVAATTDNKVDLGVIVRDVDELVVLNDEAHHIHDERMAWFKSIEDIHNRLKQKDTFLSLQVDVTATPKHNNGAIFVQTIADYPLVEAISQNVVKHPVLPDAASRAKLQEKQSAKYTEKYEDYLHLGVIEWRKAFEEHAKLGKKAVLFIMTDNTRNCDDVEEFLETHYPDLKDAVLVIHTKKNGEISETAIGKKKEELDLLRKQANEIDNMDSPYKAIVSVMVLKEGWDVRNVTTIVGLRPYGAPSNILPEQTLGRGLRKMYPGDTEEYVSVVGTNAFMEFVEEIQNEGVILTYKPMGEYTDPKTPLIIEVDNENVKKDIDKLDIQIPVLTPRIYREYKNFADLDPANFTFQEQVYQQFSEKEKRKIFFKDIVSDEVIHVTEMDTTGIADYNSVIAFFAQTIKNELKLVGGYDVLYGKVKTFIRDYLFGETIELEDANTLRNLSELAATKTIIESFKKAINELTVQDKGGAEIKDYIKLKNTRPFVAKDQEYVKAKKSIFNRIVGDSHFEVQFAAFLEDCEDIQSYAKNYFAVNFKLDYVKANGDISNYYPDFIVKVSEKEIVIVETKGQEDLDVPIKMGRLRLWCEDINLLQDQVHFDYVFIPQEDYEKHQPKSFTDVMKGFTEYKDELN